MNTEKTRSSTSRPSPLDAKTVKSKDSKPRSSKEKTTDQLPAKLQELVNRLSKPKILFESSPPDPKRAKTSWAGSVSKPVVPVTSKTKSGHGGTKSLIGPEETSKPTNGRPDKPATPSRKTPVGPPQNVASRVMASTMAKKIPRISDLAPCFYRVQGECSQQVPRMMLSNKRYDVPAEYRYSPNKLPLMNTSSVSGTVSSPENLCTNKPVKKTDSKTTITPLSGRTSDFEQQVSSESLLQQKCSSSGKRVHDDDRMVAFYDEAERTLAAIPSEDETSDIIEQGCQLIPRESSTLSRPGQRRPGRESRSTSANVRSSAPHWTPPAKARDTNCTTLTSRPFTGTPEKVQVRNVSARPSTCHGLHGSYCGECSFGRKSSMKLSRGSKMISQPLGVPLIGSGCAGDGDFDSRTGPGAYLGLVYNCLNDVQAKQYLHSPLVKGLLRRGDLIDSSCMVKVSLKEYNEWIRELSRLQRELMGSIRKRKDMELLFADVIRLIGETGDDEELCRELEAGAKLDYAEVKETLLVKVLQRHEWLMTLRDDYEQYIRIVQRRNAEVAEQERRNIILNKRKNQDFSRAAAFEIRRHTMEAQRASLSEKRLERVREHQERKAILDDLYRKQHRQEMKCKALERHRRYMQLQQRNSPKGLVGQRFDNRNRPFKDSSRQPSARVKAVLSNILLPTPPTRKKVSIEVLESGNVGAVMPSPEPNDDCSCGSPLPPRPPARLGMKRCWEKEPAPSCPVESPRPPARLGTQKCWENEDEEQFPPCPMEQPRQPVKPGMQSCWEKEFEKLASPCSVVQLGPPVRPGMQSCLEKETPKPSPPCSVALVRQPVKPGMQSCWEKESEKRSPPCPVAQPRSPEKPCMQRCLVTQVEKPSQPVAIEWTGDNENDVLREAPSMMDMASYASRSIQSLPGADSTENGFNFSTDFQQTACLLKNGVSASRSSLYMSGVDSADSDLHVPKFSRNIQRLPGEDTSGVACRLFQRNPSVSEAGSHARNQQLVSGVDSIESVDLLSHKELSLFSDAASQASHGSQKVYAVDSCAISHAGQSSQKVYRVESSDSAWQLLYETPSVLEEMYGMPSGTHLVSGLPELDSADSSVVCNQPRSFSNATSPASRSSQKHYQVDSPGSVCVMPDDKTESGELDAVYDSPSNQQMSGVDSADSACFLSEKESSTIIVAATWSDMRLDAADSDESSCGLSETPSFPNIVSFISGDETTKSACVLAGESDFSLDGRSRRHLSEVGSQESLHSQEAPRLSGASLHDSASGPLGGTKSDHSDRLLASKSQDVLEPGTLLRASCHQDVAGVDRIGSVFRLSEATSFLNIQSFTSQSGELVSVLQSAESDLKLLNDISSPGRLSYEDVVEVTRSDSKDFQEFSKEEAQSIFDSSSETSQDSLLLLKAEIASDPDVRRESMVTPSLSDVASDESDIDEDLDDVFSTPYLPQDQKGVERLSAGISERIVKFGSSGLSVDSLLGPAAAVLSTRDVSSPVEPNVTEHAATVQSTEKLPTVYDTDREESPVFSARLSSDLIAPDSPVASVPASLQTEGLGLSEFVRADAPDHSFASDIPKLSDVPAKIVEDIIEEEEIEELSKSHPSLDQMHRNTLSIPKLSDVSTEIVQDIIEEGEELVNAHPSLDQLQRYTLEKVKGVDPYLVTDNAKVEHGILLNPLATVPVDTDLCCEPESSLPVEQGAFGVEIPRTPLAKMTSETLVPIVDTVTGETLQSTAPLPVDGDLPREQENSSVVGSIGQITRDGETLVSTILDNAYAREQHSEYDFPKYDENAFTEIAQSRENNHKEDFSADSSRYNESPASTKLDSEQVLDPSDGEDHSWPVEVRTTTPESENLLDLSTPEPVYQTEQETVNFVVEQNTAPTVDDSSKAGDQKNLIVSEDVKIHSHNKLSAEILGHIIQHSEVLITNLKQSGIKNEERHQFGRSTTEKTEDRVPTLPETKEFDDKVEVVDTIPSEASPLKSSFSDHSDHALDVVDVHPDLAQFPDYPTIVSSTGTDAPVEGETEVRPASNLALSSTIPENLLQDPVQHIQLVESPEAMPQSETKGNVEQLTAPDLVVVPSTVLEPVSMSVLASDRMKEKPNTTEEYLAEHDSEKIRRDVAPLQEDIMQPILVPERSSLQLGGSLRQATSDDEPHKSDGTSSMQIKYLNNTRSDEEPYKDMNLKALDESYQKTATLSEQPNETDRSAAVTPTGSLDLSREADVSDEAGGSPVPNDTLQVPKGRNTPESSYSSDDSAESNYNTSESSKSSSVASSGSREPKKHKNQNQLKPIVTLIPDQSSQEDGPSSASSSENVQLSNVTEDGKSGLSKTIEILPEIPGVEIHAANADNPPAVAITVDPVVAPKVLIEITPADFDTKVVIRPSRQPGPINDVLTALPRSASQASSASSQSEGSMVSEVSETGSTTNRTVYGTFSGRRSLSDEEPDSNASTNSAYSSTDSRQSSSKGKSKKTEPRFMTPIQDLPSKELDPQNLRGNTEADRVELQIVESLIASELVSLQDMHTSPLNLQTPPCVPDLLSGVASVSSAQSEAEVSSDNEQSGDTDPSDSESSSNRPPRASRPSDPGGGGGPA